MKDNKERHLDDVGNILHSAKLTEDDVVPTAQTIYITPNNFYENNFKLLQLNPELQKEIEEGQTLFIKGYDDDNVVICSENKTFQVTNAETSNSLLLTNGMKFPNELKDETVRSIKRVEVLGLFYNYLEATLGKPHLKRLNELLQNSVYRGPEHEYEVDEEKLYSYSDLNELVQASCAELKEAIESMDTVTINGKIRLLDFEYHFRVLSYMLKLIEENSWQLDTIDYEETMESLQDIAPKSVLHCLFNKYTEKSKTVNGKQLYRYKEMNVCQFFAKVLLREAGRFNLNEFLQAWRDSVPEGMVPEEEMLYGIAIIDRKSNPNVVWAFDESSLPENVTERFKILFEAKEKWSVPEITPYVQRLSTEKVDVNALLAKHARASKVDGVKYYSAKHAK